MLASVGQSASRSSVGASEPRVRQEAGSGSSAPQPVYRSYASCADDDPADVIVLATSPVHSLRASTTRATRGYGSSEGSLGDSSAAASISELGASCDAEGSALDDEAGPDGSSPPLGPAVVDRLDSAHYEVRPAGLVERQDSAHEARMEAGGAFADMSSIAQRDRQDSANSLDLAARSALVFGAAGAGGGGAAAARFRTASSSAMRQQSDAAAAGLLQRQDSANEASGGGSPSRSRRVSQIDGSTEPLAAQGATANPAERPPLDRFSSASTSLSLARRLVLSLLAPDAQEEAPSGATAAAELPSHRARPELDDSPRQREQLHRTASSSGAFLSPPSPDRATRRGHAAAAAAATAFGSPPLTRPRLVSHSSVPAPLLPRASLSAGMVPLSALAGESLARARQAVMADLASNPPARQRPPLELPVSFVAQAVPQASPSSSASPSGQLLLRSTSLPTPYTSAQSARASLRRDSPMDPLVEARRVVLKDLADHPVSAAPSVTDAIPESTARGEGDDSYPDTPLQWQASQAGSASSSAAQAGSSTGGGRHRPWDSVRSLSPRQASSGALRLTSSGGGDSDDELEGYRRGARV